MNYGVKMKITSKKALFVKIFSLLLKKENVF